MPTLQVTDLSFSYDKSTQVIDKVSITINKGEIWSIIGKNGSGKSTLIRCIARLEKIKNNAIALNDRELLDYTTVELAREVAYVPQATSRVPPNFTVREYVLMGRHPYSEFSLRFSSDDRAVANEALALTDTAQFSGRSMKTLSGGELQRVFIAGAVAQRTGIILLDEPVSFLDPMHQEMIHATLGRIHREYGTTLITVTHDINTALHRSSHLLALKNGRSVYAGTTAAFLPEAASHLQEIYGIAFDAVPVPSGGKTLFIPRGEGRNL